MVRIKSRWLLIRVTFHDEDEARTNAKGSSQNDTPLQLQLLRSIRDSLQTSFGDVGAGAIGGSLAVRYYSPTTRNAIVRCSRQGLPYVWAAITFCTSFAGKRVRMVVSHCGGTIRKVQQATIRADRREIERLCMLRKQLARRSSATAAFKSSQHPIADDIQPAPTDNTLDQQATSDLHTSQQLISSIGQ